jgi:hypothetical protein
MPAKAKFRPINFDEESWLGLADAILAAPPPTGSRLPVARVLCREANWIIVLLG